MSRGNSDDDPVLAELGASPETRKAQLSELQEFADHELTLYGHQDGRTFLLCRSLGAFAARESRAIEDGGSGKRLVIAGDVFAEARADPKLTWAKLINRRDPRVAHSHQRLAEGTAGRLKPATPDDTQQTAGSGTRPADRPSPEAPTHGLPTPAFLPASSP